MSEQLLKVKATHQIVHDGQVLAPGTIFSAPESLVNELKKSSAVDVVEDNEGKPVVELKPVLAVSATPMTPQEAKIAADKKRLAEDEANLAADGGAAYRKPYGGVSDGLDTSSPVVRDASGSAAHPVHK